MAKEFAYSFYHSGAWKKQREYIKAVRFGLCERCLAKGKFVKGEIVHHKIHLTPENIHDKSICLDEQNLELLCRDCHAEEHQGERDSYYGERRRQKQPSDRYTIDEWGNVKASEDESEFTMSKPEV